MRTFENFNAWRDKSEVARRFQTREANNPEHWAFRNGDLKEYDSQIEFHGFGGRIEQFLESRRGKKTFALDLMSYPAFVRDVKAKGLITDGVAVGLGQEQEDKIVGNIQTRGTWRRIHEWRVKHAPQGFGLVTERSVAGIAAIPQDAQFSLLTLERIWSETEIGGGIFLQLPAYEPAEYSKVQEFLLRLNAINAKPGFPDMYLGNGRLCLVKQSDISLQGI